MEKIPHSMVTNVSIVCHMNVMQTVTINLQTLQIYLNNKEHNIRTIWPCCECLCFHWNLTLGTLQITTTHSFCSHLLHLKHWILSHIWDRVVRKNVHYKWRKSLSSIFLSSLSLNWCSSWVNKVEELCSCLLLCPATLLSVSWRSSFIYLAFLRFCRLLLCGDQMKQVIRCINSQFNKISYKKVHRTCCRYSSLTKVGISLCFLHHTVTSQQK